MAPTVSPLHDYSMSVNSFASAYHDMATYSTETGLGGLDASIGFETDRAQNIGTSMNTSLLFFGAFQSKTSSSQ
jgi:hypothetical protein